MENPAPGPVRSIPRVRGVLEKIACHLTVRGRLMMIVPGFKKPPNGLGRRLRFRNRQVDVSNVLLCVLEVPPYPKDGKEV
jgi:hypothetical protein